MSKKICFTNNERIARDIAVKGMARYLVSPNYRNTWLRIGFKKNELERGGNKRFFDSMVLWGSEDKIRAGLQAHRDSGATQIVIQPLNPDGSSAPDWRALEAFRPETW